MEKSFSPERQVNLYKPTELLFSEKSEVDEFASDTIIELVTAKPDAVLVLPTGNTPKGMYELLAEKADHGRQVDFSQVTVFNLDEYWKIGRASKASFRQFMQRNFYQHVNIPKSQRHIPDGQFFDPVAEADYYQARFDVFRKKGIDLAVIGIGQNGHIGFNEPGTDFDSRTSAVALTEETRMANAPDFREYPDEPIADVLERVPHAAITLGLGEESIRAAKKIVLLAKGDNKATALGRAFRNSPTEDIPASVLQYHPDVTIVSDLQAGAELAKRYTQAGSLPRQSDIVHF